MYIVEATHFTGRKMTPVKCDTVAEAQAKTTVLLSEDSGYKRVVIRFARKPKEAAVNGTAPTAGVSGDQPKS